MDINFDSKTVQPRTREELEAEIKSSRRDQLHLRIGGPALIIAALLAFWFDNNILNKCYYVASLFFIVPMIITISVVLRSSIKASRSSLESMNKESAHA